MKFPVPDVKELYGFKLQRLLLFMLHPRDRLHL